MTKCYLLQAVLKLIYFFCIASINREVPTNFPFNIKLNNLHHKFLKMSCVDEDILNILYISSTRPPRLKTQDVRKLWKTRNVIQLYIVHCPHGTTKRYFSIDMLKSPELRQSQRTNNANSITRRLLN